MGALQELLGFHASNEAFWQLGLLSRRQLLDAGLSKYQINRRVSVGLWSEPTKWVYNVMPGSVWENKFADARKRTAWLGLLAYPNGIATGISALALHDVWGLPHEYTPEVAFVNGASGRSRPEVKVRRFRDFSIAMIRGRRIAAPADAFAQALPQMSREIAISSLDNALNRGILPAHGLELISGLLHNRAGVQTIRHLITLANPLAQSPFESRARLECIDAGLPPPVLQARVRDTRLGRGVARGDLGWKRDDDTWVLVDLDGKQYHDSAEALVVDRRRQNAIALAGQHTHLRFAWQDLGTGTIPREVARALRGANGVRPQI